MPGGESIVDRYLSTIGELKGALEVPVIASLNATSTGAWIRYAQLLSDAGADAIELNLYRLATDPVAPRPTSRRRTCGWSPTSWRPSTCRWP